MKTTARNQFAGSVSALALGPVSAEVTLRLRSGDEITATMTSAAAKRLKRKKGKEALALINEPGAVSSLVVLTLPGGAAVTASVTNEGIAALGLKVGTAATAVFRAYAVMVATQG